VYKQSANQKEDIRHRTVFADRKTLAEFLRRQFPRVDTTRRKMAGIWATVINNWFLMHKSAPQIEEEKGWEKGTVKSLVQKLRRAVRGDRLDGKPRTGRPRGRPKGLGFVESCCNETD
jgi:hypothetical protein